MFNKGQQIGRYQINSAIGAGGMGEVFLAEDTSLDRKVALKILHADVAQDSERLRRFTQEAKATSALNHPNIITIYEIGKGEAFHFIVTEFVEGKTLREHLKQNPFSFKDALEIAVQIASALRAAHTVHIVHRDIKPENIMIRHDGLVKLLDFGIAKLTEKKPGTFDAEAATTIQNQTVPGVVIGTAAYMSPEQAQGKEVDARSDIFSFGAVLYEMLTGKQPFAGDNMINIIGKILFKEPSPISELLPNIPSEFERIINKTLCKDKSERYQSSEDLLQDLKALQRRLEFESEDFSLPPRQDSEAETRVFKLESIKEAQTQPPNNLSEQLTAIVGREEEIKKLGKLLLEKDVRLVTMTGIGGTGKTTLAKAVARELLSEFPDGVFFVELDAITNHELVAPTIAQTLGVKEAGVKPILEILKEYLADKQMLLVMDNFEQVAEAAFLFPELLSAANRLKILITSRTLLHLSAEKEFTVPPLAVPSAASPFSLEEIADYESVKLFVKRAQNANQVFALTRENAPTIAEICSRLDGLPLAIELAAARVKILTPQAILAKLENRLKLLTGGARDLPARQQTMRNAVEWSYELLDEAEKQLFRRLAVFAGGFTFEAAEAVCSGAVDDLQFEILDLITSLVDKSLLIAKEQPGGEMRFRMLEVVREYALESLEASGQAETIRNSHADYFLSLAEAAEPHFLGAESVKWLNRLEEEHDNLRVALDEVKKSRKISSALRFGAALWRFWLVRGYLSEGRRQLAEILEMAPPSADQKVQAKILTALGTLAQNQGDYELARSFFERSLLIWRETGDKEGIATTLNNLGWMAWRQSDYAVARSLSEEALALHRQLSNKQGVAHSLNNLGWVAHHQGDFKAARDFHEESLALRREMGDKRSIAFALNNLGWALHKLGDTERAISIFDEAVSLFQQVGDKQLLAFSASIFAEALKDHGNYQRATEFLEESLSSCREIGSKFGAAFALRTLGDVTRERKDYHTAITILEQSISLFREIGDKYGEAYVLNMLANVIHDQGDDARALPLLKESLNIRKTIGDIYGMILCLELLAAIIASRQQSERAAWLCGLIERQRTVIGASRSVYEQNKHIQILDTARAVLGEEAFKKEFELGRAANFEHAVDRALKLLEDEINYPKENSL